MSAYIVLNLFIELEKRDKMRGLPSILSPFRSEFKETSSEASETQNPDPSMARQVLYH